MRRIPWTALLLCYVATATGSPQAGDVSVEGLIRRAMRTGEFWTQDDKYLAKAGDNGAVVLARLLSGQSLSDEEIAKAVAVVDSCYQSPARVEDSADREPRTTLLLLRYFDLQIHSLDLKKIIAETRKGILSRYTALARHQAQETDLERTIDRVLKTGVPASPDNKTLARAGDAGAVVLTRILTDKALSDEQIDGANSVVESCFDNLPWVQNDADREPRTALLLLRYLDFQAHSPDVKKRIAETRKAILDRYAAYAGEHRATPAVAP